MRTLVGPSIVYNLQRAFCAGVTLNVIFATVIGFDAISGGDAWFSVASSGPYPGLSSILVVAFSFMVTPLIYVPVGLVAAWLRRQMGEVSFELSIGGFLGLYFALILNVFILTCVIVLMLGDPGVLLLKRIAPDSVPVDRPKLWNPHLLIRVEGDPDELAAARAHAQAQRVQAQRAQRSARPAEGLQSTYSRNRAGPAAPERVETRPDWTDTIAGIESLAVRQALERANQYLDHATAIVHPPNEISLAKADEIERLLILVRAQLDIARSENAAADEPGVANYIEFLDACGQQYGGMALAIGRRQLSEGARQLEDVAERLERVAFETGGDPSAIAQTHFLLSLIYWEMGNRSEALSFIGRAIAVKPDEPSYRRLRAQIEDEVTASVGIEAPPRQSGGMVRFALIALLVVVGGGAGFYLWSSNRTSVASATSADPDYFEVRSYAARETIVAREGELNIRTLPFARPDIPVLRESIAGEVLAVTGLVNQADGPWYQVRLADGRTGYFKSSLAVPQSEYLEAISSAPPLSNGIYVQQGVCPFEGCVYRQWRANANTQLYQQPNDGAPIISRVFAGESIAALRGEVHIAPLRGVVVRALGPFQVGDTVYRLSYRGEGTWDVWHNGAIADTFNTDYWSSNPVFDFGPNAGASDHSVWWVFIQRGSGESGWSRETDHFDGKDQFG